MTGSGVAEETPADGPSPGRDVDPLAIVQVVRSDGFAGVERYMAQVANALTRRGHHVLVVGGDPARMRAELHPGVEHAGASSVTGAARVLAGHRRVDIVHAHMTAAETAAWLAHPVQRAPIVATRHFAAGRGSSLPARLAARIVSRSIAVDIAISQFVADSIEGPSVLLPNAVPDRDQARLESPTVTMLQRLTVEKSPQLGLRAWSESGLADRGWRLAVAGVGGLGQDLVDLADRLGVAGSVDFEGLVADTDTLLEGTSVLLAPAAAEPFGLSVVEAMAHGVPVVAAGGGAHLETVGEDGLLFPPGDASAAARYLADLAEDPSRRLEVGAALRQRQRHRYSLPDHVLALEALYGRVVTGQVVVGPVVNG
jgi:glycosyltransferase involved in cell wall biosynthesis